MKFIKILKHMELQIYKIVYFIFLFSLVFFSKIVFESYILIALSIVVVYNCIVFGFFVNIGIFDHINKEIIDYIKHNSIPLVTLFCAFVLRFFNNYSIGFSICFSFFFILIISYSRSYIWIEEYVRLCAATISILIQTIYGSDFIATYLSMMFLVIFGRLGMELVTKILLRPEIIKKDLGGVSFYNLVLFYIRISNLRQGKKGILFNVIFFSLLPNFWIFLFYEKVFLAVFWSFFLLLLLIANTSYCLLVADPRLSLFVAGNLMKKYPYSYKNKLLEIHEFVIKENYYVLDSEKYKVFGGSGWLVMKYLDIKEGHVMCWAAHYLHEFKRHFVIGINQTELQTEINARIMKAVFYFQQTGNIHENIENKDYLVGNELLKLAIAEGKDSDKKLNFCKAMNFDISKELSEVDYWWERALEAFFIENSGRGLKGEGMLRNMGSAMHWARIVI